MRTRTKWLIGVLAVLLSLPLLATAWIFVAMDGGIYGIIASMKPRPDLDSAALKRDRARLAQEIDTEFGRANPNGSLVRYETSTQDSCYDGANNWKHSDGFAHRCTLRVTDFYGFDGDFRITMLNLEKALLDAGWHSNIHDMVWTLTRRDASTESHPTVDYLPNPYPYYKAGFALDISWAERGTSRLFDLKNIQARDMGWLKENIFYDRRKLTDPADVFRKVTQDHRYIIGVAISGHYFEN